MKGRQNINASELQKMSIALWLFSKEGLTFWFYQKSPHPLRLSVSLQISISIKSTFLNQRNYLAKEFLVKQDHQRWGYGTVERFAKKLNKDKRKEQRNNYILIWGGSSSVSIFFTSAFAPLALRPCVRRICRWYEGSWHSLDFYWLSTNFYWLSTDFHWLSTDFY